jgi:hypothetical protein
MLCWYKAELLDFRSLETHTLDIRGKCELYKSDATDEGETQAKAYKAPVND